MKDYELPPYAPILMEATRAIGYSLETAIADIVDNSVSANARKIFINFFPIGSPYISILDDGRGMTKQELIEAMRYGSSNPLDERNKNDLGRFGLGLKTASMSQCRRLTVISKKGNELAGAQWDLDYIANTRKWTLQLFGENDFNDYPHFEHLQCLDNGTLVVWQELDRLKQGEISFESNMGKSMDKVRKHLSLVFHRYLKGETGINKVEIIINNTSIEAVDPFLSEKSTQIMDDEIINIQGQKVFVRPYILPHISKLTKREIEMLGGEDGIRKEQGFYVYRNKRLLVWGTWFKMMRQGELSKLARVRIDIPNSLDSLWTLDIKKSMAVPPEVVRKNVVVIVEKLAMASKRTWTYRGRKETDDEKVHIWKRFRTREGGVLYEINREHPLVELVTESDKAKKTLIEQLLTQIERSIPLNQLYVDLTSDEKILNEGEMKQNEIVNIFKQMFLECRNSREREELVKRLSITEPFNQYPDLLKQVLEEVF